MTTKTVDLHPEGLLEEARRGELTPSSEAILAEHLRSCPGCEAHLELIRNSQPMSGDEALLARVVDSAVLSVTAPPVAAQRAHRARWLGWLAAAAVMFTAAVSLGTVWYRTHRFHPALDQPAAQG